MAAEFRPNESFPVKLAAILATAKRALWAIFILSAVLNVLLLSGSLYMMAVYDLVLPSHSEASLFGLAIMVVIAYMFQGILEFLRGRLLQHFASSVDVQLNRDVHGLISILSRTQSSVDGLQPVRDLDQLRSFLSGAGPTALVDLPWMLFFFVVLSLLHPYLGLTTLIGGGILILLTYLTEKMTIKANQHLTGLNSSRMELAETTRRHAEVLAANGMQSRFADRWVDASDAFLAAQGRLSGIANRMSNLTKIVRMLLQSVVLTVGALLVLEGKASGGVIFASSILSSRALAPVELAIANWRGFVGARQSWARLKQLLQAMPALTEHQLLSPPTKTMAAEAISLGPPGTNILTLRGVNFHLKAGEALAVLGPSGCGKSTLIRAITGIWPLGAGDVRLDNADLNQWPPDVLGKFIGYLPQNVELLSGTVAQNIARFEPDATSEDIIAAARLAGVHDLVLHLPEGYDTPVGPDGRSLSGGQRQRIALARALYGSPFLVVLDEPNSNLDNEGEAALAGAIAHLRERGAIVVVVAHRPSILASVDLVLLMKEGRVVGFGPKERLVPQLLPTPVTESLPGVAKA
ncbi:type I secretion system permease/ATPase [Sphingobium sufflavum]|uniref:type I secretion system permease/ATPase n=1 Tax=Sphingobium sufflavum TaxID=1129547 RepID=UPI001F43A207|nr:type I secretion system permease/ATPase [Sphingobium sufflavum]MCE7798534.1 type I secretion system permease/ATPase [Sphingobium sufflavum]